MDQEEEMREEKNYSSSAKTTNSLSRTHGANYQSEDCIHGKPPKDDNENITRNQIGYIIINQRFRNAIID